jgi:hypothetical protein
MIAGVASAVFALGRLEVNRIGNMLIIQRDLQRGFHKDYGLLHHHLCEHLAQNGPDCLVDTPEKKQDLEGSIAFLEGVQEVLDNNLPWYFGGEVISESWVANKYGHAINTLIRTPVVHVDLLCQNPEAWKQFIKLAKWQISYNEAHNSAKDGHKEAKEVLDRLEKCTGKNSAEFRKWQAEWKETRSKKLKASN